MFASLKKDFVIASRYPVELVGSFAASVLMVSLIVLATKPFVPKAQAYPPDFVLSVSWGGFLLLLSSSPLFELSVSLRQERTNGTLEQLFLSPSPKLPLLLGRALRSQILSILYGTCYLASAASMLGGLRFVDLPQGIYYLLLGIPVFYGLGLVVMAATFNVREIIPAATLIQIGVAFLSGILFPFNLMPYRLRILAAFLPTSYSIDLFRSAISGSGPQLLTWAAAGQAYFLESLLAHLLALALPVAGMAAFNATVKRAKRRGGLQQG
ncbi:MAG: ABC transporter permease [Candidatus Brockarchaeota archaeon]|nr:ABC transporter permease [Candidatus Brockarchaeota archaeon]